MKNSNLNFEIKTEENTDNYCHKVYRNNRSILKIRFATMLSKLPLLLNFVFLITNHKGI